MVNPAVQPAHGLDALGAVLEGWDGAIKRKDEALVPAARAGEDEAQQQAA